MRRIPSSTFLPFESFFPKLHLSLVFTHSGERERERESGGGIRYPCILSGYFPILNINRAAPLSPSFSFLPAALLPSLSLSHLPWIFQSNFISGMATNGARRRRGRQDGRRRAGSMDRVGHQSFQWSCISCFNPV